MLQSRHYLELVLKERQAAPRIQSLSQPKFPPAQKLYSDRLLYENVSCEFLTDHFAILHYSCYEKKDMIDFLIISQ